MSGKTRCADCETESSVERFPEVSDALCRSGGAVQDQDRPVIARKEKRFGSGHHLGHLVAPLAAS
jgi:hypothetical protein